MTACFPSVWQLGSQEELRLDVFILLNSQRTLLCLVSGKQRYLFPGGLITVCCDSCLFSTLKEQRLRRCSAFFGEKVTGVALKRKLSESGPFERRKVGGQIRSCTSCLCSRRIRAVLSLLTVSQGWCRGSEELAGEFAPTWQQRSRAILAKQPR